MLMFISHHHLLCPAQPEIEIQYCPVKFYRSLSLSSRGVGRWECRWPHSRKRWTHKTKRNFIFMRFSASCAAKRFPMSKSRSFRLCLLERPNHDSFSARPGGHHLVLFAHDVISALRYVHLKQMYMLLQRQ